MKIFGSDYQSGSNDNEDINTDSIVFAYRFPIIYASKYISASQLTFESDKDKNIHL